MISNLCVACFWTGRPGAVSWICCCVRALLLSFISRSLSFFLFKPFSSLDHSLMEHIPDRARPWSMKSYNKIQSIKADSWSIMSYFTLNWSYQGKVFGTENSGGVIDMLRNKTARATNSLPMLLYLLFLYAAPAIYWMCVHYFQTNGTLPSKSWVIVVKIDRQGWNKLKDEVSVASIVALLTTASDPRRALRWPSTLLIPRAPSKREPSFLTHWWPLPNIIITTERWPLAPRPPNTQPSGQGPTLFRPFPPELCLPIYISSVFFSLFLSLFLSYRLSVSSFPSSYSLFLSLFLAHSSLPFSLFLFCIVAVKS